MEHELILVHFEKTIRFIHQCLKNGSGSVLVHCVYGQSRSACVCVAYLMAKKHMTLLDAFNAVQTARPCIYINPGFMKQLGMFQNMDFNPSLQCLSPAHAQVRLNS
jgi:protein-tyrosine phosphatase